MQRSDSMEPASDTSVAAKEPPTRPDAAVVKPPPATGSHDEAFDLFGPGVVEDLSSAAAAIDLSATSSPSEYTLFPQAPLDVEIPRDLPDGAEVVDDEFVLFPVAGDLAKEDVPPYSTTSTASSTSYASSMTAGEAPPSPTSLSRRVNGSFLAPPQFKNSGNAVDIIAVRSTENLVFTTPWHVMFSWSRFRSNATTGVGDIVRVLVNGKELPTRMQLLERGRCFFTTGGLTPPKTDFEQIELFEDHPNLVRFEHYQRSSDSVRYVESRLYLWGPNESIVVADLDGTLTISDVEGHIRTLRLGQYDFLHKGACDFFTKLHELNLRIVYLTARPLDWASASRTHLENAKQAIHSLPPGPLITNSNGLTGALLTEVVNKNPHVFKTQVMNEIQLTLIHAGRVVDNPVFVAGFGNRPTDVIAYEQVGVDPALIFLIDPYSCLKATTDPRIYESYADPNAMLWLLPRLKHKVPFEKVSRIDDYTVRELVLAEDREQLLMAEREARRLQEEEYEKARRRGSSPTLGTAGSVQASMYGAYAQ
ncbi:hypothetical protein P43SY_000940 [Pythium insidiosum]|uniref:LNS2/PITP domain-containing protein n=1 Tax=Pythium insidiosum TaxID=114742 RepID=A0AAD5Q5S9_PYTIN|nr:hypothetical protein P43SY_000940 [Pythium insidiosum]